MSSDEEDFNLDVSGDDSDFAPEPAKRAPAKKVCVIWSAHRSYTDPPYRHQRRRRPRRNPQRRRRPRRKQQQRRAKERRKKYFEMPILLPLPQRLW